MKSTFAKFIFGLVLTFNLTVNFLQAQVPVNATYITYLDRISGPGCAANGPYCVAMGQNSATSTNLSSFALGIACSATGETAFATGNSSVAAGKNSFSGGLQTRAPSFCQAVFGRYNTLAVSPDPVNWVLTDPLFVIGNGTSTTRANALTVLKNGAVLIKPSGDLGMGSYTAGAQP